MTAAPDSLAAGWLSTRVRRGPVRLIGELPDAVVTTLTRAGHLVLADDPEAVGAIADDPGSVTSPGAVPPGATVAGLGELPRDGEVQGSLLTVAVLAGERALGDEQIRSVLRQPPRRFVDDHLVVGADRILWVARWEADADVGDGGIGDLPTRLLTRLVDAATALALGTGAIRDEVGRLQAHARNVERQLTAARQAAVQAERMHNRLATRVAGDASPGGDGAKPAGASPTAAGAPDVARLARRIAGRSLRVSRKAARRVLSLAASRSARPDASGADEASATHGRRGATPGRATAAPFRVGLLGDEADSWLGGYVRTELVTSGWVDALHDAAEEFHALVVSSEVDGWDDADLRKLVASARDVDVPIVGLRHDPTAAPWFDGLVDFEVVPDPGAAGSDRLIAPRPGDAAVWRPLGWQRQPPRRFAVLADADVDPAVVERLAGEVGGIEALVAVGAGTVPNVTRLPDQPEGLIPTLGGVRAVVDHPRLHVHAGAHAARLVELALAKVSLVCVDLPAPVAELLGDELGAALRATTLEDLEDPDARERRAVDALRAAWRAHSVSARWRQLLPRLDLPLPRPRTVSIVLATNRPEHLDDAVARIASQTWAGVELVVGLHGDAFPSRAADDIIRSSPWPTQVVPVGVDQPLGQVLNRACQAAGGDVVTKWDDDDFYGPDHVVDLLMAMESSGATLVGKGSEFVYLADIDVTIRRTTRSAHSTSRTMGGGTLAIGRDDLRDVGWWPHVPRAVDQRLIDAVLDAGGTLHRTHGLGFVLNRHGVAHTWAMGTDYFLQQAEAQRRGLDLEFAGCTRSPSG